MTHVLLVSPLSTDSKHSWQWLMFGYFSAIQAGSCYFSWWFSQLSFRIRSCCNAYRLNSLGRRNRWSVTGQSIRSYSMPRVWSYIFGPTLKQANLACSCYYDYPVSEFQPFLRSITWASGSSHSLLSLYYVSSVRRASCPRRCMSFSSFLSYKVVRLTYG